MNITMDTNTMNAIVFICLFVFCAIVMWGMSR
jgi:hypothetical protein